MAMLGGTILSLVALYMISGNPSGVTGVTVAFGVVAGMIIGQGVRTAVTLP